MFRTLDLHDLIEGQKTKHSGIAAYGSLALLADRLGTDETGDPRHGNLAEQAALDRLAGFVDDYEHDTVTGVAAD